LKRIIPYFTVFCLVLTSTVLLWSPFLLHVSDLFGLHIEKPNFQYVYKQFDGPFYIIPAKTLYDQKEIRIINRESTLVQESRYYAAHLPLYPLFIRAVAPVVGYLRGMIGITFVFSVALACFFYFMLRRLKLTEHPMWLTAVFLFLPRFLIVRSVGAPETLFIFLLLVSLYAFEKNRYFLSGLAGALAVTTKSPGMLLFFAYGAVVAERFIQTRKWNPRTLWLFLIPLGFVAVCLLYAVRMGDFLAYFHSGDNIHLVFPFSVFNFQKPWVGTAWLEDVLFYLGGSILAVYNLRHTKHRSLFYFSLVFITATAFVQHRDIARYSLPLWPMAAMAFEKQISSRAFRITSLILIFGIYMYAWNMLVYNIMPINEWLPFL